MFYHVKIACYQQACKAEWQVASLKTKPYIYIKLFNIKLGRHLRLQGIDSKIDLISVC